MLPRVGRVSLARSRVLIRAIGLVPTSHRLLPPCRFLSVDADTSSMKQDIAISKTDNSFTPQGAVFSNPDISSDWIYREEKDTGRQYYVNTKTNEILYNRTPNSSLAPRWRRFLAGSIDGAISLAGGVFVSYLAAFELGDVNLGYAIGRIYAMLFFCAKDCVLDHGTRSIGKRMMKLEVVNKHGELSGLYRNFFRNSIELCTSFTPFLGMPLFMGNGLLVLLDGLCFLCFKKRIFDFALGTRIISETNDHVMRVKLYKDKLSYKRQSETLEEAGMSGLQQMINQQKKYDDNMALLEEMKKKEKASQK